MGASNRHEDRAAVNAVRGLIVYLCLLATISSVILTVQASMEEKKIRYLLTDMNKTKKDLLDRLRKAENRIAELERYERVASLAESELPHLGPPRHPAIEIRTPGLSNAPMGSMPMEYRFEDQSWMARFRSRWREMEKAAGEYFLSWIE